MSLPPLLRKAAACAALVCSYGCATAPDVGTWGAERDWLPGPGRFADAARDAFTHPWTWVPALGALTIGVAGVDDDISEWATEEHPLYGSREDAIEASNDIKSVLADAALLSILAADSGSEARPWLESKALGYGAYYLSTGLNKRVVSALKESTGRERFDGSDEKSFPSQHTASAIHSASWTNTNIDFLPIHEDLRKTMKWLNLGAAGAVAWARVEAGKHYTSDVLIGAALGNASAVFLQRAFLGVPEPGDPEVLFSLGPDDSVTVGLRWSF